MNKNLFTLLSFACLAFLMQSCASISGLEEARSLGEGNSEIVTSLNLNTFPELNDAIGENDSIFEDNFGATGSFPNLDLSFKYGITDKLDLGIRANTNLNLGLMVKYELMSSENFAVGSGIEIASVLGLLYNVQVPLNLSFYPTEKLTFNLAPRFIYQTAAGAAGSGINYLGGNGSIMFGKKNKFGLDVGYYSIGIDGSRTPYLNVGVGGKFFLGDERKGVGASGSDAGFGDRKPAAKRKKRS